MNPAVAVLAIIASYFFGTVPSAIVVAKSKGVDITSFGSGNPGASNVSRALGLKYGVMVFVIDFAKSAIPAAIMLGHRPIAYACGAAALLGHIFPITRKMKGGKGVASGAGALLPMHPIVIVVAALSWATLAKVSKKASVASIVVVAAVVVALGFTSPAWETLASVGIALLIEIRHLPNIKRLISGNELKVAK
jgi:glycerol-3-phosphate acyltransferase PlsY